MTLVAKRRRARNSDHLPLFDWAERARPPIFDPLLITSRLAGRVNVSPSVLNAMAEAHGFTGREVAHG